MHAIQVEGLTKRFGRTTALAGIDLNVDEGTVVALLGPNGAGKTTLVRLLATLLRRFANPPGASALSWRGRGARGERLRRGRALRDGRGRGSDARCQFDKARVDRGEW